MKWHGLRLFILIHGVVSVSQAAWSYDRPKVAEKYQVVREKDKDGIVCVNRRARYNYSIEETFEAGLVLVGSEVKSLRGGKANLTDSYGRIGKGEAFLFNAHISPYAAASGLNHEPTRSRKLLLHKREIQRLTGKVKERGLTLIPLKLYFKNGRAKVELALARGKKVHDKREVLRRKAAQREVERSLKSRR